MPECYAAPLPLLLPNSLSLYPGQPSQNARIQSRIQIPESSPAKFSAKPFGACTSKFKVHVKFCSAATMLLASCISGDPGDGGGLSPNNYLDIPT